MARARNIKPGFFDNSDFGELDGNIRLLYIALWTMADREGVIEFDLKKIRRYVFGYKPEITEEIINGYITVIQRLDNGRSLRVVDYGGKQYLYLPKFSVHQNPHHTEKKGGLPTAQELDKKGEFSNNGYITVIQRLDNVINPADSLIPDSLIPDSSKGVDEDLEESFSEFWDLYPTLNRNKGSRVEAKREFCKALKLADFKTIIEGVNTYAAYLKSTGQSNQDAFRWLAKQRWADQYEYNVATARPASGDYLQRLAGAAERARIAREQATAGTV